MINFILENSLEKVDEKIILIAIIGSLEAIKNRGITINEAEKFLFSPYMVRKLRLVECSKKIVGLIEKGCELEDIESLMPEKLNIVMDEIKEEALEILSTYVELDNMFWVTK